MLAARHGCPKPTEFSFSPFKAPLRPVTRLRRVPVGAHAIFHRHLAGLILTERSIDLVFISCHVTVHDGPILFFHFAAFPELPQLARGIIGLAHANHPASLTIQPVD